MMKQNSGPMRPGMRPTQPMVKRPLNKQQPVNVTKRKLAADLINKAEKADLVIQLALIGNALLTALFAFKYLPSLFDAFNFIETEQAAGSWIVGIVAALFAVTVFDAAYYAWGNVEARAGNSNEQIATAGTAKKASLVGSLFASAGQFVLSQNVVPLPSSLVFVVSIAATVAVAAIALLHMHWFDKYQKESFEARELKDSANEQAAAIAEEQERERDKRALAVVQENHKHEMEMRRLEAAMVLERLRLESETDLEIAVLTQNLKYEKDVSERAQQILQDKVNADAQRLAEEQSRRLHQQFLSSYGEFKPKTAVSPPAPNKHDDPNNPPPLPAGVPSGSQFAWDGGKWVLMFQSDVGVEPVAVNGHDGAAG